MTAIIDFERFMKDARWGQPLHRGALATDNITPVVHECDPKALTLTPQLQKEKGLEALRNLAPAPTFAPSMNPGGGGGNFGTMPNLNLNNFSPAPPSQTEE